jgi:hypothetical protein
MLTLYLITPDGLAILTGGYRYHVGDRPARSCGMGTVTGRGWLLNRSADMFVLLSWEQPTQHSRHPRGTAI